MSDFTPGWFWPADSNRAHFIVDGRSLCGKWAAFNSYGLDEVPPTTPCKACCRKLPVEETSEEVKWCEEHGCQAVSGLGETCWYHHFMGEKVVDARTPCRIVSRRLVASHLLGEV